MVLYKLLVLLMVCKQAWVLALELVDMFVLGVHKQASWVGCMLVWEVCMALVLASLAPSMLVV